MECELDPALHRKALGWNKQLDLQYLLRKGHESCFTVDSYHYSNVYRMNHMQDGRESDSDPNFDLKMLESIAEKVEACSFMDATHSKIVRL